MDDNPHVLSDAEAKYFDTKGQADLPLAEAEPAETTDAPAEKPAETKKPEPEAKTDEKAPPQIEVVSEDDVADGDEPDGRKYVKVGALRKEREKAKQFRQQVEQERQQRIALEQQLQALRQPQQQQREPEPVEILNQTAAELAQLKASLQENASKQQFITTYQQKAQEFIAGTEDEPGVTDFPDAYQHALGIRRSMYEIAGYNPQQVNQLLESEEAAIVERAMMNGENPAKAIYQIAKKLGYTPKQSETKAQAVNEQVEKQAQTADKTLEAAKKLEKIAKGMDKNKSLAGSGGGNEAPSLEELLGMDEAEFTKHTSGAKFRELMGG